MPKSQCYVTYLINEDHVASFINAVSQFGDLIRVVKRVPADQQQVASPVAASHTNDHAPRKHYANGVRNKGITGEQLAIEILLNSPSSVSHEEFAQTFVNRGFARTSASPVLSKLQKSGRIQYNCSDGRWALAPSPKG